MLPNTGAVERPLVPIVFEGTAGILRPIDVEAEEDNRFFLRHDLREWTSVWEVDGAHVNGLLVPINHFFITLGRWHYVLHCEDSGFAFQCEYRSDFEKNVVATTERTFELVFRTTYSNGNHAAMYSFPNQ